MSGDNRILTDILAANDVQALKDHIQAMPAHKHIKAVAEVAAAHNEQMWAAMESAGLGVTTTFMGGYTPLITSAMMGNASSVTWLMAKGADMEAQDAQGLRALDYAASSGHHNVVDLLLEKLAIIPLDDFNRQRRVQSAAHRAISFGQVGIVERWILAGRIDPQHQDGLGETWLMKAVVAQQTEVVDVLLPLSDVDAQSNGGQTALMIAAKGGHLGLVQTLIKAGASTDSFSLPYNGAGKSVFALEHAVYEKHWDCVDFLALHTPCALVEACITSDMPLPMYKAKVETDVLRATLDGIKNTSATPRQRTRL